MVVEVEVGVVDPHRQAEVDGYLAHLLPPARHQPQPLPDQRDERVEVEPVGRRERHHAADVHRPGAVLGEEERRVERRQAVRHPAEGRAAVGRSPVAGRGAGRRRWPGGGRSGGRTAHRCRRAGDAVLGQEPARGEPGRDLDGGPGRPADGRAADRLVVAGLTALDAAGPRAAARDGGGHRVRPAVDRRRLHEPAGRRSDAAAGRRRPARAGRGGRRAGGARGAPGGQRVGPGPARAADRGTRSGRALHRAGRRRAGRVRRRRLHHAGAAGRAGADTPAVRRVARRRPGGRGRLGGRGGGDRGAAAPGARAAGAARRAPPGLGGGPRRAAADGGERADQRHPPAPVRHRRSAVGARERRRAAGVHHAGRRAGRAPADRRGPRPTTRCASDCSRTA